MRDTDLKIYRQSLANKQKEGGGGVFERDIAIASPVFESQDRNWEESGKGMLVIPIFKYSFCYSHFGRQIDIEKSIKHRPTEKATVFA